MAERTVPHAYPMSVEYEMSSPRRIYDQNFGEGLSPQDMLAPTLYHGYYIRPRINKQLERGFSEVDSCDDWFRVLLDVCQFTPDELSVRTVDNLLEVSGHHAQRLDQHGFISRDFTRTYILPMGVDPLLMQVSLSHDAVLCVEAPRKSADVKPSVNELKIRVEEKEKLGEAAKKSS
ncbi:heat shock protein beta-2 [Amia ocellicauda]|uniref:heat shock protein beta-2 n=1 Tax=Amia ocellicauda TaxID=2972642 RepID=UPI003464D0A0|nr:HSPB2 protein [Amia calva]